jgi:tRNA pseudouridine38-40 synthase
MRYFIEIAYKGTNFHGWQIQPNAISIQEKLQDALKILFGHPVEIIGAGRTDTGVHASQFFAHFDCHSIIDTQDTAYRINALLPKTIVVREIFKVDKNAHARFDALSRSYKYCISLTNDPFTLDTSWQITNKQFDVVEMNKAAKILLNHTNFKAFSKSKTDVKTYDCTIIEAFWVKNDNKLIFYITANRFLRNMVRAIVGTLLDVGVGKLTVEDFEKIIISKNRSNAGLSVPARGLFLTKVRYPKNYFEQ